MKARHELRHLFDLILTQLLALPLDNRQHGQCLTIRHRCDGNLDVEFEITTHTRAEGDLRHFAVGCNVGQYAGETCSSGLDI